MNHPQSPHQQTQNLILKGIQAQEQTGLYQDTKSFFVADLSKAEKTYRQWATQLPGVTPYYGLHDPAHCNIIYLTRSHSTEMQF